MSTPLPVGFRISVDAGTKRMDDVTLFGGSPARVLRLSAPGLAAWRALRSAEIALPTEAVLARRLTDSGLAHPRPPALTRAPDVTVVVPVRDRAPMLARCLAAVGRGTAVVVVDDGSTDPAAVADVVAEHGATLVRRANGGPAAARNTGLDHVSTELVAFLDSDCVPTFGWIEALAAHFADPLVAAAAPRIVGVAPTTSAGRYAVTSGGLDMGEREARVVPGTRVGYVPTAALVVRRVALTGADPFDPGLRYGEDVDLVWRLHEAGWRIRYDPAVQVRHHEPGTWPELLARRFHYGTSAGPLARRHPTAMAPLVLRPGPTVAVFGLLTRRPAVAALGLAGAAVELGASMRRAGLPLTGVPAATVTNVRQTWLGLARWGTQFAAPLLAAALLAPRASAGRRVAAASLLFGPSLLTWATRRPALDPVRYALGGMADDVAYGAGVIAGSVRARTWVPVRPVVSWRQFRSRR
ncbi:MAG TPA: mycofactocin biosynthesis glycosyltransferase MftF [Pseudonocardiaceae bacterium]